MKMKKSFMRIGTCMLAFLIGISCMTMTAFASEKVDTGRKTSLTAYFGKDGKGFAGVELSVYRVATMSETGAYALTGDFEKYPVSLENHSSSQWRALAQTLDGYAARDSLTPLLTGKTGQDGKLRLTGLSVGLYLVTGKQYSDGDTVYTLEPMLVSLPGQEEDGVWSYDLEVSCKFNQTDIQEKPVTRKVQKVWNDGGSSARPKQITVQLLQNGKVVDAVLLSQKNNWEYTWENLDGNSKWQIVEGSVPSGYSVSVTQEGTTFVITNTRSYKLPGKLPQTGMLWWPVPVLATVGILLVIVGVVLQRNQGESNEK